MDIETLLQNLPGRRIPFLLEGTTIHLNYTSSELATGSELILMRFDEEIAVPAEQQKEEGTKTK